VEEPDLVVDPEILRLAMRQWATGVTIVTTYFEDNRHGMTVSSFTSISLEPPLVMVSLEANTRTHALVKSSGIFGVTILEYSQADISDRFAGRHSEYSDRFNGIETFVLATGVPLIPGGLAALDCILISSIPAGTHTIFIGEVLAAQIGQDGDPLIYYNRDYRRLAQ
jgi:flavin reductase (DIM6/NTAB) family NADH-FMN oxidoreductase RutF